MGLRAGKLIVKGFAFICGIGLIAYAALSLPPLDTLSTEWARPAALAGAGILVIFVGLSGADRRTRRGPVNRTTISGSKVRERSNIWLRRNGVHLSAEIIAVSPTMRNNQKPGWEITARGLGPQTGKTYTFRSDPLDFNPSSTVLPGNPIAVMIDPDNPKEHWVDTTGIKP